MSKYEEIISEIRTIYLNLKRLEGYHEINRLEGHEVCTIQSRKDRVILYRKYLKLLVQIQSHVPDIKKDYQLLNGNCYFYELGLPIPTKFEIIGLNVGEIGGHELSSLVSYNQSSLLDFFKSDLDYLDIRYFRSDIKTPLKHGGYKVAVFINNEEPDYHFARQNFNGIWSQKFGYKDREIYFNASTGFIKNCEEKGYEYI